MTIEKSTTTRKCPSCNQDVEIDVGLNKTNIDKLFKKPTLQEVIILFIIIISIASFLGYRMEINAYKTYMNENCTCDQYNNPNHPDQNNNQLNIINFSEFQEEHNDENNKSSE